MKKILRLFQVALLITVVISCSSNSQAKNSKGDSNSFGLILLLSLDKQTYDRDEEIFAKLLIKNNGGKSLLVNKRMALNGYFVPNRSREVDFIVTNPDGKTIKSQKLLDIHPLSPDDFVMLFGREAFEQSYPNIGYWVGFDGPGEYTIQARYENQFDPEDGRTAWKGVLYSNIVKFTVNP